MVFESSDIISVYTDEQALEDGILVDITEINLSFLGIPITRMTITLWADFEPFTKAEEEWEVRGMTIPAVSSMEKLRKIIRTKLAYAKGSDGLYLLPGGNDKIWLIINEIGTWTLLYASDY